MGFNSAFKGLNSYVIKTGRQFFFHGVKASNGPWPPHYRGDHSETPHLLGPLWISDQSDAEISK